MKLEEHQKTVRARYPKADIQATNSASSGTSTWWYVVVAEPYTKSPKRIGGRARKHLKAWEYAAREVRKEIAEEKSSEPSR